MWVASAAISPGCNETAAINLNNENLKNKLSWTTQYTDSIEVSKPVNEIYSDLAACFPANAQVAKIQIFSSPTDLEAYRHPTKDDHTSFEEWVQRYDAFRPGPMAFVLLVGKTAIVRKLDKQGIVSEGIGTVDLREQHLASVRPASDELLEILDIAIQPHIKDLPGNPADHVTIWARTSKPLAQINSRDVENLLGGVSVDNMTVLIRNDAWFIRNKAFPIVYPFEKSRLPPPNKYPGDSMVVCRPSGDHLSCELHN